MRKRWKQLFVAGALLAGTLSAAAPPARASELVYTPINPSLGGSPLNGSWLLGYAGAQNKFSNHGSSGYRQQDEPFVQKLAEDFSRRTVSRIENEILDALFDGRLSATDLGGLSSSSDEATIYIEVNQYGDGNTSNIDLGY